MDVIRTHLTGPPHHHDSHQAGAPDRAIAYAAESCTNPGTASIAENIRIVGRRDARSMVGRLRSFEVNVFGRLESIALHALHGMGGVGRTCAPSGKEPAQGHSSSGSALRGDSGWRAARPPSDVCHIPTEPVLGRAVGAPFAGEISARTEHDRKPV
ncbi:hypothetical protein [Actinoplanes sp. NPDC049681]|uniref:hypothetical protein n=1 Tax=Actinoplanes sp. NPDC049681 TaxID=3363905 RepID=UPI0037A2B137